MTIRKYSSRSQQTTLSAALTASATSATVLNGANLRGTVDEGSITTTSIFTVVIDPDTSLEEIVDVTGVSGNTLTIVRGRDGSTGQAHSAGAVVRHMVIGRDLQEANDHIENTTTAHGITLSTVVKTTDTGTVSSGMLATGAVGTVKIDDTAVTAAKLAPNSVTTAKIVDANVTTAKIADLNVTTGKIADSAITSAKIADGTIATGDIADGAVTSAKIADLTIATGDIADGAVTSAKIADGTIVNADVNTSAQIAYGKLNLTNSIVNDDINASAAIDPTKISGTAVVAARTISTTAPLSGGGDLTANRTLSIADASTSVKGAVQLTDSTSSTSTTTAATPNSVKSAYDLANTAKTTADAAIPATQKGANNGVAPLDATGKVPFDHMPASVIADTFVVSSQSAMLALSAGIGDIAVRTDVSKSYILQATPASTLGNWVELLTPADSVTSVDGLTGTVVLSGLYDPLGAAASKLPLTGGTMSGNIAMASNKITGLADPTSAQDAATKNYIDTAVLAPSNLTGPITSVGNVTSIASQTGTGTKFVVDQSPTIVTPTLSGNTTAGTINGTTIPTSKTLVATDSTDYVVPSQAGNSGKYLTTDGTTSSWASVDALPSQTGNSGKYLTTNGSAASWANIVTDPTPSIFMLMGA